MTDLPREIGGAGSGDFSRNRPFPDIAPTFPATREDVTGSYSEIGGDMDARVDEPHLDEGIINTSDSSVPDDTTDANFTAPVPETALEATDVLDEATSNTVISVSGSNLVQEGLDETAANDTNDSLDEVRTPLALGVMATISGDDGHSDSPDRDMAHTNDSSAEDRSHDDRASEVTPVSGVNRIIPPDTPKPPDRAVGAAEPDDHNDIKTLLATEDLFATGRFDGCVATSAQEGKQVIELLQTLSNRVDERLLGDMPETNYEQRFMVLEATSPLGKLTACIHVDIDNAPTAVSVRLTDWRRTESHFLYDILPDGVRKAKTPSEVFDFPTAMEVPRAALERRVQEYSATNAAAWSLEAETGINLTYITLNEMRRVVDVISGLRPLQASVFDVVANILSRNSGGVTPAATEMRHVVSAYCHGCNDILRASGHNSPDPFEVFKVTDRSGRMLSANILTDPDDEEIYRWLETGIAPSRDPRVKLHFTQPPGCELPEHIRDIFPDFGDFTDIEMVFTVIREPLDGKEQARLLCDCTIIDRMHETFARDIPLGVQEELTLRSLLWSISGEPRMFPLTNLG